METSFYLKKWILTVYLNLILIEKIQIVSVLAYVVRSLHYEQHYVNIEYKLCSWKMTAFGFVAIFERTAL